MAIELERHDPRYSVGVDHPAVGWSSRAPGTHTNLGPDGYGNIDPIEQDETADPVLREIITSQVRQLYEALGLRKLLLELAPDYCIFDIAHHIGLNTEQEYQLLATTSEHERQEIAREHLETILPVVLETERLKERVKLNGHFKKLTPPNF